MVNKNNSTRKAPSSQSKDKKRFGQVTEVPKRKIEPTAQKKTVKKSKSAPKKVEELSVEKKPLDLSEKPAMAPKKYRVKTVNPPKVENDSTANINLQTVDSNGGAKNRGGNDLIRYMVFAGVMLAIFAAFFVVYFTFLDRDGRASDASSYARTEEESSLKEVETEPKNMTDAEVDQALEGMSVEERAALILIGAPNDWSNTVSRNFTINEIVSGSFTDDDNQNYSFEGLQLQIDEKMGIQYFSARNIQPDGYQEDDNSDIPVFTRKGTTVNYGTLNKKTNKINAQSSVNMRDIYRQYGDKYQLNQLADRIYPV